MTTTQTTQHPVTADYIRMMIRPTKSSQITPGSRSRAFSDQQQSWIWRCLLHCHREMRRNIENYRSDMGRVENRNSPAYWVEWMSDLALTKNSDCVDIHAVILSGRESPARPLSGRHLENAVNFLTTEGVAETVLQFVQRPL